MTSSGLAKFLDLPSAPMRAVAEMVSKIAPLGSTVFIQGPSGSGKEIIARAIHVMSDRAEGPFVPVNCGAIPRDLLESELFGYEKGAFTGAARERAGLMELSAGGTLFLDEIGDMPLDMQVKLLRMLEERSFTRVGGSKAIRVDVRFVCATHRDLRILIEEQKFREDLYYRINVFPIVLPPLRDRSDDIPVLVGFIKERFAAQGFPKPPELTVGAIDVLKTHDWPGNVRELRNILERAGALYPDRAIDADLIRSMLYPGGAPDRSAEQDAIWDAVHEFARFDSGGEPDTDMAAEANARGDRDTGFDATAGLVRVLDGDAFEGELRVVLKSVEGFNLKDYVSRLEVGFIRVALADTDGSVSAAARVLGVQRTTLIEKMRNFGIGRPE